MTNPEKVMAAGAERSTCGHLLRFKYHLQQQQPKEYCAPSTFNISTMRSFQSFVCASCRRMRRPIIPTIHSRTLATDDAPPQDERPSRLRGLENILGAARNPTDESRRPFDNLDFSKMFENRGPPLVGNSAAVLPDPPHRLHVYTTKHNTHLTFTAPLPRKKDADPYKAPDPNQMMLSLSTGQIGFKKGGRGEYDAAYQLAAFMLKQIQERGLMRNIKDLEVVLRGFGPGREAVTKVLLGQEGRMVRNRIVAVVDATRLKFGGNRSPKPRRLG